MQSKPPPKITSQTSDNTEALEEPCIFWVDQQGLIQESCAHALRMSGYRADELSGHHISVLLPDLAGLPLLHSGQINPRLAYRCHIAAPFRVVGHDGQVKRCNLFINLIHLPSGPALTILVRVLR